MAELADVVTIAGPAGYANDSVYFSNGGDTQYMQGMRIVPPETRVWDVIGLAWTFVGTNWNNPGAVTAKGNGGLLKFTVHNQLGDGTPNLTSTLATDQLPADTTGPGAGGNVYRYDQRTRGLLGITTNSQLIHMQLAGGLSVVAGQPLWVIVRNLHADPVNNASGPAWVTSRDTLQLPDGTVKTPPNHVNTTVATASYSVQGLDPRECVASKALATDAWVFGRLAGAFPGATTGVDNGNNDARIPTYFWRELGSTRIRSKYPYNAYRIATGAVPTVTRTNAVSAASLKYAMAYPTTSGTCTVTLQVINADGSNKGSAVVSPASASAPTGGGPVIVQFASPVAVAVGEGVRLTCSKAVWANVADAYLRRALNDSDDWLSSGSDTPNYPGISAFGARGVGDWPWGYANRQAFATAAPGATGVATNIVTSASVVSFSAERGTPSPAARKVRVVDSANGATKGFTATVTGDTVGWLKLRVGPTGTPLVTVTGTCDADLYLVPTNQATNGNYAAGVHITPAQSGDTVADITATLSVTDPQPVGTYDNEVAAVATRLWKLEEPSGLFTDTKGGAGLLAAGAGLTRAVAINSPVTVAGFRNAIDGLGATVLSHWPLGESAGIGSGTVTYGASAVSNSVSGKTSATNAWPAGAAVGQIAVLGVHIEGAFTAAVSSGGPTAWTQRDITRVPASGDRNSIWTKRIETADLANPVSVTWGGSAVRETSVLVTVSGAKLTGEYVNQVTGASGTSATFTAPGLTTTAKCEVLYFEMSRWDLNETPPAGFTERIDQSTTEVYVASLAQTAAGAVTAAATTPTGEVTDFAAFLVAIEPEPTSAVVAVDRKGARNAVPFGTITRNVPTLLTDSTTDGAAQVGGTDAVPTTGYFEAAATSALQTPLFTVIVWCRITGGAGTSRVVISHRDVGTGISRGWYIVAATTNRWRFLAGLSDGTFVTVESTATAQVGQTVMLAATWEAGLPKLYVNAAAPNSTVPSGTYAGTHAVSRPLRIGAGTNEAAASGFFRGVIDDCVVLDSALTAAQITALYTAGITP